MTKPMNPTMAAAGIDRRAFLKGAAIMGGATAVAGLAACAPKSEGAPAAEAAAGEGVGVPSFMIAPEQIVEFAATHDHEIVAVGAGVSGVSAVMAAAEAGADVALVQKQDVPSSSGNMAASVSPENSTAAKSALVSYLTEINDHRSKRELLQSWADNSYEAITWFADKAHVAGIDVNEEEPDAERDLTVHNYPVHLHANTYFGIGHDEVVKALAGSMEQLGATCYYSMPAVQLATDDSGNVTGVVCQNADGAYELFNASKGVILATGDYQNDREMVAYYCPDIINYGTDVEGRSGDGHKMGLWAGAAVEPSPHTKMIHDWRVCRADAPFLLVNYKGERFMCEGPLQGYLNNYLTPYVNEVGCETGSVAFTLADAKFDDEAAEWQETNPEVNVRTCKWYFEGNTWEEAVQAMRDDPDAPWDVDPEAIKKTVERYNELCAKGEDDDFGKDARYMRALDTPPFRIVPRDFSTALPLGGLIINKDYQVLKAGSSTEVIGGLYAVGNVSGPFFGGVDYPMDVLGLSIGRAITGGYCAGRFAAAQ